MKKTLTILIFSMSFLLATAQPTQYISSSSTVKVVSGSTESYASPNIYVFGAYDPYRESWDVKLKLSGATPNELIKDFYITLTKAVVDTYTGTGTGDTFKLQNALQAAVITEFLVPINGAIFTNH